MNAGEAGLYLFSACTVETLLWHPLRSPVIPSKRRCSPVTDGLGDGSDDHRARIIQPAVKAPSANSATTAYIKIVQTSSHTYLKLMRLQGYESRTDAHLHLKNASGVYAGIHAVGPTQFHRLKMGGYYD